MFTPSVRKNLEKDFKGLWSFFIHFGLHMIYEGFQPAEPEEEKPTKHSFYILALTAVATSIDAMAVGASLAFMDVSIFITSSAIGFDTSIMVTIGVMLGCVLD